MFIFKGYFWKQKYYSWNIGFEWSPPRDYSGLTISREGFYKIGVFGTTGVGKSTTVIRYVLDRFVKDYGNSHLV